jgi:hypothetical protein
VGEAKNNPEHAIADFDEALKLDPSLADARRRAPRPRVRAGAADKSVRPGPRKATLLLDERLGAHPGLVESDARQIHGNAANLYRVNTSGNGL